MVRQGGGVNDHDFALGVAHFYEKRGKASNKKQGNRFG
jgi:hypothetical protein